LEELVDKMNKTGKKGFFFFITVEKKRRRYGFVIAIAITYSVIN
jgi:hypothetical protein